MSETIITVILSGLFAAFTSLVTLLVQNKRNNTENLLKLEEVKISVSKIVWEEVRDVIELQKGQIQSLQDQLNNLDTEIQTERTKRRLLEHEVVAYKAGLLILISQLQALGVEPKWSMPNDVVAHQ